MVQQPLLGSAMSSTPCLSAKCHVSVTLPLCDVVMLIIFVVSARYAWILQDLLGMCFCVSLIRVVRLPNLKISTILLLALLVYDVFFVFITPFFSARGKSVMVEVATGWWKL